MARKRIPKYRLHTTTGRAVVTTGGREIYLGRYDSPESREKYNRLIAEWLANGRTQTGQPAGELTVAFEASLS